MMFLLAAIIASILAGCGAEAPLEDEPGWNCATMGNGICGGLN